MQIDIGEDMPKNLKKLLQRRYMFQLLLNEFNLKDGFENYTVAKIFEEYLHDTKVCQNKTIHKIINNYNKCTTKRSRLGNKSSC
jgi:hypothetical protein